MNFKDIINPKKTIKNLPTQFSWRLFTLLFFISVLGATLMGLVLGFDEIKKMLLAYGNYAENSIVSNIVIVQSLFIIAGMSLLTQVLKVGIVTFICQKILHLFKKRIEFFKLINLYLYAAIVTSFVAIFKSLVILNDTNKDIFTKLFLGKIEEKDAIAQLYASGNYAYIFFGILSIIIFYVVLIYGAKILLSKSIVK